MRLDQYIAEKYHFTRNKAQQLIKSGLVSVNGKTIEKSSLDVRSEDTVTIKEDKSIAWVSRSAGKLDGFLSPPGEGGMPERQGGLVSEIRIDGSYCLDIGSSTGGFSQVLLERGASHIDAVDVGSDQLHAKIRDNDKISLYEKMDIRDFHRPPFEGGKSEAKGGSIPYQPTNLLTYQSPLYDIITCDVSFISLREIIPEISRLSDTHTHILLLFKPQFEVGKENLRKTGVPKDEKIIMRSLADFRTFLESSGFQIFQESKASVIGEAGNQEYMFYVKKV